MPSRVRSFSKINLGLTIGPKRPDGYHGLATVYQTLAVHDFVSVEARPAQSTRITLQANHPAVPCTSSGNCDRNTAYKMVTGALDRLRITAEVHITIEKRLPVQGGLGAGSANAAAALIGLERELGTALPLTERLVLAAEVGSDVPLFLMGGTVLGLNRGESVYPLPDSAALPVVVAVPNVGVSTTHAFRDLDAQMETNEDGISRVGLTQREPDARLEKLSRVFASVWTSTGCRRVATGIAYPPEKPGSQQSKSLQENMDVSGSLHGHHGDLAENPLLALVQTGVENDFESVAFRQHPSLQDLKRALLGNESGASANGNRKALYAALSGSGSALFGIYGSPEAAREAQQRVQSLGTRALLTETLPRQEYWQQMFA